MPIEARDALSSFLEKIPKAMLDDQEEETFHDIYGNLSKFEFIPWAKIRFINSNTILNDLVDKFEEEFVVNRYTTGFNNEVYCVETIKRLTELKSKFCTVIINGKEVRARNDFIIKYLSREKDEFGTDHTGNKVCRPTSLILDPSDYGKLSEKILSDISDYFTYQEKTICKVIEDLDASISVGTRKRKYGTTYNYTYFKFDYSVHWREEEARENIISFFRELIGKGYVEAPSLKSLDAFFSDNPSHTKVKWLKSRQELKYLIDRLVEKHLIKDPKRQQSVITARVFLTEKGLEFKPEKFHSLHKPTNTRELDDIIGILK